MPLSVSAFCPPGWEEVIATPDDVRFVATDEPRAVQPSFTATIRREPKFTRIHDLRKRHASEFLAALDSPRLIDESTTEVDERPASRVLVAAVEDGNDLTVHQWVVPVGSRSVVVTATALAPDFPSQFVTFQDLLESVAIGV